MTMVGSRVVDKQKESYAGRVMEAKPAGNGRRAVKPNGWFGHLLCWPLWSKSYDRLV